jgi:hypothetical protein
MPVFVLARRLKIKTLTFESHATTLVYLAAKLKKNNAL